MDKYYTPSLDEFYVGFEYEIRRFQYYDLNICDEYWDSNKFTFDFSEPNDIEDIFNEGREAGNIRVKCLDKEDIEELGFKYLEDISTEFKEGFTKGGNQAFGISLETTSKFDESFGLYGLYQKYWHYTLDCRHNGKIFIRKTDKGFTQYGGHEIFVGIVNNKSELKKLLKQLGIE